MTFTIDRINRLLLHVGLTPILPVALTTQGYDPATRAPLIPQPAHRYLDVVDKRAGINTKGRQVGARLTLLERRVSDFTFWLGADGENPDRGRAECDCDCSCDCDYGPGCKRYGSARRV
jgi:hypothetical protein